MDDIDKLNFSIVNLLKQLIERINTEYDVNMRLFQPGIEPLSIIGKTEKEIILELENNIVKISSNFSQSKVIPINDYECQTIFALKQDELKKLMERISSLSSIVNCSSQDEEFSKMPFVEEANAFVNKEINEICLRMLLNYLKELIILIKEFEKFTITTAQEDNMIWTISSPQTASQLFRIYYKDCPDCYCTIADAIRDNVRKGSSIK